MSRSVYLVVDDDPLVLRLLQRLLPLLEGDCYVFENGERALAYVEAHPELSLSAAFLDYHLPGLSGSDVAQALRQRLPDLPMIFISGSIAADNEQGCAELGQSARLAKPFTKPQVEAILQNLNLL